MDAMEGVKCWVYSSETTSYIPLRALSFMTAGEWRKKMEKEGEDKRMEGVEKQVKLAVISRSSV